MAAKSIVPSVARLSSRVILILGCNPGPMTLQGTNTYLVGTGNRRILIDAGEPDVPQYLNKLKKVLEEEKCEIEQIVVSHWHYDHIGGVPDVLKLTNSGCKVWKHEQKDEAGNLVPCDIKVEKLTNGQVLTTEGASLRVIHTPGHTTDHVVLTLEGEEGALFSGDTILGEGTAVFDDLLDYMNSLKIIQKENPKVIYPGHGPVIKTPDQVISHYLAHRQAREDEIIQVLKMKNGAVSATEIVSTIYPDLDTSLLLPAEHNVRKHLAKLVKENRACLVSKDRWKHNGIGSKM